ncbi:thiolase family protein [[Mycobacterium] wendilense]|uniref:Thiolase family protein n=1 Tax=[Mycobacterium] wendilense TaxID=3064284 RepID=A0ABN9P4E3_9MYCO|nr:thiolase family protein [Mycolicibacterium sp. MU0050]CAJ1586856.1 thiolase family protein [Mycolicibacterium sp. MU0050]
MANGDVWILGIHMTKFGKHPELDVLDLASEAAMAALADGGVSMRDIEILTAGNLMAGGQIGQQIQKQIGQTGIPVINVANACATGATALRTAIMAIKAGEADYGLAVGAEKLAGAGLLGGGGKKPDRKAFEPRGRHGSVMATDGLIGTTNMPGTFAQIGMEYLYDNPYDGAPLELFARIAEKNHAHSTLNPLAAYQKKMSLEQIMGDVMIAYPNTRSMCSANCDGAAAAVVVSDAKLRTLAPEQRRRAVKISASVLTSDPWEEACQVLPDINTLTRNAATQAYELAGVSPEDLDLVELHDCFATAELVHYDNLMLCRPGEAVAFFESGATWRDGSLPVNVSGGLQSKGHPIAATGIANVWEVCHHLRGEAGDRQIEGATVGLAHVIGLGSACGIHILEKAV